MKIFLKDRNPMNVLFTNNHILDESDIKIGSKINIKCENIEQEIEINDYRFVSTDKYLNYTCIQIFNNEFAEEYFNEKNYSIIRIKKSLSNNKLVEFNNLNSVYEDIEKRMSLEYFLGRNNFCFKSQSKLYEEMDRLYKIEERFRLLSLMGIKLLLSVEKTNEIKGFIKAPENSPYRNGIFKFKISFSNYYPEESPNLFIETNIFHCNYSFQI